MKTVLAIRHMHFEDLGSFEDAFRERGYQVRYCDVGVDDLASIDPLAPDILAALGGPIGVYEDDRYPFIRDELRILRQRLDAMQPTLGFCLGAQMMAGALGARVRPGPAKEIGWAPSHSPIRRRPCMAHSAPHLAVSRLSSSTVGFLLSVSSSVWPISQRSKPSALTSA